MEDEPRGFGEKELSLEEKQVLVECRRNAVFHRGIPAGIIGALLTRQTIRSFVPSPYAKKLSSIGAVVAFFSGAAIGIASYSNACITKILALENSALADTLRAQLEQQGRGHSQISRGDQQIEDLVQPSHSTTYGAEYSTPGQSGWATPLAGSKIYENDQSMWDAPEEAKEEPKKKGMTYEELRQNYRASQHHQYQPYQRQQHKPQPPLQTPNTSEAHQETTDDWGQVQTNPDDQQSGWSTPLPGSRFYESERSVRNQNDLIWDVPEERKEEPKKKGMTYEELRQKHRSSQHHQYQPYQRQPRMPQPPVQKPKASEDQQETTNDWGKAQTRPGKPRRNQYGDLIE